MTPEEITSFLRKNVEPLRDAMFGNRYRAAARLKDGTYLPCVVFQNKQAQVDLALRRFKETRWRRSEHRMVVESFVSWGSHVADYVLKDVELSPFAWSLELLRTIHGETTMGWTAFVAEMTDGTMHSYGTPFNFEFFDLPEGYSHSDIAKIHSGMVYSNEDGLQPFSNDRIRAIRLFRDKPFFTCFLKAIPPQDR